MFPLNIPVTTAIDWSRWIEVCIQRQRNFFAFKILWPKISSVFLAFSRLIVSVQSILSQFSSKLISVYSMIQLPVDIRDILSRIHFDRFPIVIPNQQHLCRLSEPIVEKFISIYRKLILVKSFVVSKFIGSVTVSELSAMHTSIHNNTFVLFHTMYRRLNFWIEFLFTKFFWFI